MGGQEREDCRPKKRLQVQIRLTRLKMLIPTPKSKGSALPSRLVQTAISSTPVAESLLGWLCRRTSSAWTSKRSASVSRDRASLLEFEVAIAVAFEAMWT